MIEAREVSAAWTAARRPGAGRDEDKAIADAAALLRANGWRVEEPKCRRCQGRRWVAKPGEWPRIIPIDCPICNGTGKRP